MADVQLIGITRGLQHLHFNHLIHGDLKGVSDAFGYPHNCANVDLLDLSLA